MHWLTENVEASGKTHRLIVLKRWKAYCHLVFWGFAGSYGTQHALMK
jgi:hypothetical protein